MAEEFDLVVRGGTVADGTGGDLRDADVAIRDGRIAAIGAFAGSGREEIPLVVRLEEVSHPLLVPVQAHPVFF